MISIRSLEFAWPGSVRPALTGLSLELTPGQLHGLIGPNGSGKTTLARLLARELQPSNSAAIHGLPLRSLVYSQRPEENIFSDLTVGQHLDTFIHPTRKDSVLGDFPELARLRERYPDALSGGQSQLLGLAVFLGQQVDLYLLDEPTNHLAPAIQERLLDLLGQRIRGTARYALVISHDVEIIRKWCPVVHSLAETA